MTNSTLLERYQEKLLADCETEARLCRAKARQTRQLITELQGTMDRLDHYYLNIEATEHTEHSIDADAGIQAC